MESLNSNSKRGTAWTDDELDLIVSDYFTMLGAELSGTPYTKSHHSAALMIEIDRSHRSVEFKHQNISAVLDKLGLPWIRGYKPKWNFQNSIFDAIDRFLSNHNNVVEPPRQVQPVTPEGSDIFIKPPTLDPSEPVVSGRLGRLIAKFDPVKRDFINRTLGAAGEAFVVELEKRRMTEAGRADLVSTIRWISKEDGDGAGYDVLSFDPLRGKRLLIEVKTTNGSATTPFFLTRTEVQIAEDNASDWRIYRLHHFATDPKIFVIAPPLDHAVRLTPESWRASF